MTTSEILAEIAKLSKEEQAKLLSKSKSNTYKVVDVIRLYWSEKPSKEDREAMSKAGYHWNSFEKYWFADATDSALKFAAEHNFEEGK